MKQIVMMVVALAVVGAACGSDEAAGPPEINYGRDICIECGMVIEEARFAAAYRLADGTEKTFDDVGGLIIHGREAGDLDGATIWVHDFETEDWVEAPQAFYVPTIAVASPMGHGILSFADEERATKFANDLGGEVLGWEIVVNLPVVEGLVGDHHMSEDDMGEHDMDGMEDDDQ
jgi:copper chaperone NosL